MKSKGIFVGSNRNNGQKIAIYLLLILAVLASIFCMKRFLKNSNIISYDLSSFNISEGYSANIIENSLNIIPENPEDNRAFCAESSFTLLPKGSYSVGLTYVSDGFNVAYLQAGDSIYEEILLPAGEQTVFHNFVLNQPVEDARLRFFYNGPGSISIKTMIVEGDGPILTDWILIFGLIWGMVFATIMYAKIYSDNLLTREHLFEISFVLITAVISIPVLEIINKGIYWGVDTNVQNMRIEGLKDAIIGGQFPVVIAPSMCNGYGSIEPIMYPSLFLYPFAFLRILGVSPVLVYKVAHFVINLFMCSTCYVCVKKVTRSIKASCIALVAFAFSKFHLEIVGTSDSAYGMGIAMIFMFVVIIGSYEIFVGNKNAWPYLTIGMWGVMNSHVLSALFAAVIVGIIGAVFFRKAIDENRIKSFLLAIVASIPLCMYRIYTFLDAFINNDLNTGVLNLHIYDTWVLNLKQLILKPTTSLPVAVAFGSIAFILIIRNTWFLDYRKLFVTFLTIDLICILFMSTMLPWNQMLATDLFDSVFGYIQYPSRLSQIAIPITTVMIGIMVCGLEKESLAVARASILAVTAVICFLSIWSYKEELYKMSVMDNAFSGKLTGDVISFPGMNDYVPEGENESSYDGRTPYFSSDSITIDYDSYKKNGVNISGIVSSSEDGNYIDFPLFAYKGYECLDENGVEYKTGIGEHHRLRVFFDNIDSPSYINITYSVPLMYYILQLLSYATLFVIFTFNENFFGRVKERIKYYQFLKKGIAVDLVKRLTTR